MQLGDIITWKTKRNWNSSGKIIEFKDDKVRVEAINNNFKVVLNDRSHSPTKPKYWIIKSKILTVNGVSVDAKETSEGKAKEG